MIRATETARQLEARLEAAETDRDEARQRLKEVEQRAPVGVECCAQCQQQVDGLNSALTGHQHFVYSSAIIPYLFTSRAAKVVLFQ